MKLNHPPLVKSLQKAYSAEKAAAFAYIGHASSLKNKTEIEKVKQIEEDEWIHRKEVLQIMQEYNISISSYYELKFFIIGKIIAFSCHIIGWFMPYFFAGKLESGNVCEYFIMKQYFNSLGITKHDEILYEMGMKEKEHEVYFLEVIESHYWMTFFEKLFRWGKSSSLNNVDLNHKETVKGSSVYCKKK